MAEQIELEQDASLLEEREQQMRQLEVGVVSLPIITSIVLVLSIQTVMLTSLKDQCTKQIYKMYLSSMLLYEVYMNAQCLLMVAILGHCGKY